MYSVCVFVCACVFITPWLLLSFLDFFAAAVICYSLKAKPRVYCVSVFRDSTTLFDFHLFPQLLDAQTPKLAQRLKSITIMDSKLKII